MSKIGFDNQKYLTMQSEHIKERISQFGDKLYLEYSAVNYLTITTHHVYFQALRRTASSRC